MRLVCCKTDARGLSSPFHNFQIQLEGASYDPGRGSSSECKDMVSCSWTSQPPELWEIRFCFFVNHSVCSVFFFFYISLNTLREINKYVDK